MLTAPKCGDTGGRRDVVEWSTGSLSGPRGEQAIAWAGNGE